MNKIDLKRTRYTLFLVKILLSIFILDFFFLFPTNVNFFTINHLILGNESRVLSDIGCLLNYHNLNGQYWRLFTVMFLHSGIPHITANITALCIVGNIAEKKFNNFKYFIIYFGSGIIASLVIMFITNSIVGASGAIYGLIGCFFTMFLKERKLVVNNMSNWKWVLLFSYLILSNIRNVTAITAHIVGFISGVIITMLIYVLKNVSDIINNK